MTKDEIIEQIEALRGIIAMGEGKLAENQYLDMELMQSKVDETCQEVADLSPEDAGDVRAPLETLLEDLQAYSNFVSKHIDENPEIDGAESDGG